MDFLLTNHVQRGYVKHVYRLPLDKTTDFVKISFPILDDFVPKSGQRLNDIKL